MRRQVSLEEISDGKLYGKNDMVRACTLDCKGCSACCSGMGNSVILDPLDIYRLTVGLGLTFEELMADKIELNVVDGVILPNLKMSEGSETCAFLDAAGRCSIHAQRPGICRLFPLGRYYLPTEDVEATEKSGAGKGIGTAEDAATAVRGTDAQGRRTHGFRYFLQVHECPMPNRTKVKVSKWIDTPELDRYERFVSDWHDFLEDVQQQLAAKPDARCEEDGADCAADRDADRDGRKRREADADRDGRKRREADADGDGRERRETDADERAKQINLLLLKLFFARPYEKADFYVQFEGRLAVARDALGFA